MIPRKTEWHISKPRRPLWVWLENLSMETIKSRKREAATGGVLLKKVFLEISQNSQENTKKDSFLVMLQALYLQFY